MYPYALNEDLFVKIMCYWLDFCKSAYAICPDKFHLVYDLGCSICSYPTWVGLMECFFGLSCWCGLVGCVSEANCPFLFLYRSYFDFIPIPTTILSFLLLKTLSLHSPSSRRRSHNPNKQTARHPDYSAVRFVMSKILLVKFLIPNLYPSSVF